MAGQLASTTVVKTVTSPPPDNPQFEGWYIASSNGVLSTIEAISCPDGQTARTIDNYATCCDIGINSCSLRWTACDGSVAIGSASASALPCATCRTMLVYDQWPLPPVQTADIYTQIICASNWYATSIYRTVVAEYTTQALITLTATTASAHVTSGVAPNTKSRMTPTTTSASNESSNQNSHSSLAWIAGAVIGPVAALAIILGLFWTFRLREKRKSADTVEVAPYYASGYRSAYGPNTGVTGADNKPYGNERYESYEMSGNSLANGTSEVHEISNER